MRLQTSPSADGSQFFEAFCFSTDSVGDAVYIMGDKVGDRYQVTKVDIDDLNTMPAVGVITAKLSSSICVVQHSAIWFDAYTGLPPNAPLFINTTGQLQMTPPAEPTVGRRFLQMMAQAVSSKDVLISVRSPIILVAA